jgi:tetratricopeptide (TPR) repeat protein
VTVPPARPGPGAGDPDPFATLVIELNALYTAAGRPAYRKISAAIARDDTMPDTVSHETVGAILRGEGLSKWTKIECVVRQLATMAVHRPDPDAELLRFHALWVLADDVARNGRSPADRTVAAEPPAGPPPSAPDPPAPVPPGVAGGVAAPGVEPGPGAPPTDADRPGGVDVPRPRKRVGHPGRSSAALSPLTGTVPHRNPVFTGRAAMLEQIRNQLDEQPWRALVLHGLGGVGKTRLAVEYAHRQATRYDLVHWIAAEQAAEARLALVALADRLDLTVGRDTQQAVRAVLRWLDSGRARWLLVFDNANAPDEVRPLLPAAGGHVLITTRDATWRDHARAVEVDVFSRPESIELLRHRGRDIAFDDADRLADLLGDLPLALEQVAAMQSATGMPAQEYLGHLGERNPAILAEGAPRDYPATVAAVFGVAFTRLRDEAPVSAQLLMLLSCLGAEPVSFHLLRAGRDVDPPLGRVLDQLSPGDDVVRWLNRYGLVRVDEPAESIQVHRLVQRVVRNELAASERDEAYTNARRLLAAANPGDPDNPTTWFHHARIGPHLAAAGVLEEESAAVRTVVLDQVRYLQLVGEYEGSRRLGERSMAAWAGRGDDYHTLVCERHVTTALLLAGAYEQAEPRIDALHRRLTDDPRYGPDDPLTLYAAANIAYLHRIFGRYGLALAVQQDQVARYRRLRGEQHERTLWARNNLAVCLRLVGDFAAAYEIDVALARARRSALGLDHQSMLVSATNTARDLYGLGRYDEALAAIEETLPTLVDLLGIRHTYTLLAGRTLVMALRKTGRLDEALVRGREHYLHCQGEFGPGHQNTLAATMTYANALRAVGDVPAAGHRAAEAVDLCGRRFGKKHPLALAAAVNMAATMRDAGEWRRARQVDEMAYNDLRQELGDRHPYTLAAGVGLAGDLMLVHEEDAARSLLERLLADHRKARGPRHPDTLTCAVNLGLLAGGKGGDAASLTESVETMREVLGSEHPQVRAAEQGRRGDCDIEPPPV